MIRTYLTSMAWLAGVFFTPETFLLHGRLSGLAGLFSPLLILMAFALHSFSNRLRVSGTASGEDEIRCLKTIMGGWGATFLLLLARPAAAVLFSTALLVTCGFIFNENFVYWFPNFGFAVLMLVLVVAVNLAGLKVSRFFQLLSGGTTIAGLLLLVVLSFWHSSILEGGRMPSPALQLSPLVLAVLAFVGYDLLPYVHQGLRYDRVNRHVVLGLALGTVLMMGWDLVSLESVPRQKLAQSTIPHFLVARAVSSPYGREIMGLVSIAGALAAVNYFFRGVAQLAVGMSREGLLPVGLGWLPERAPWPLIGMAATSGGLMAMGFAGSDWLDTAMRAALILWLFFYGAQHLTLRMGARAVAAGEKSPEPVAIRQSHLILILMTWGLAVCAVWTHAQPTRLLTAIAWLAGIGALTSIGLHRIAQR